MKRLLPLLLLLSHPVLSANSQQASVSPATPEALTQAVEQILTHVDRKDWKNVAELTAPLRRENPDTPEFLLFEAAAAHGLDKHSLCERLAREFLDRFPESVNCDQALYLLGSSLFQLNRGAEAAAVLSDASKTTADPQLRTRIRSLERSLRNPRKARIGIRLGGKPPEGVAEIERARQVGLRMLELAIEDFHTVHGRYPEGLEMLLEGSPPVLKALPEDPTRPGFALEYRSENGAPSTTTSPGSPAGP